MDGKQVQKETIQTTLADDTFVERSLFILINNKLNYSNIHYSMVFSICISNTKQQYVILYAIWFIKDWWLFMVGWLI